MSEYIPSENPTVRQIEESLKLSRNLFVSCLLMGEPCSGKRTLIRRIFPQLPRVDARDLRELTQLLEREQELIIEHFEALEEPEALPLEGKRIIAVADTDGPNDRYDQLFAFLYHMPTLRERPEDLPDLIRFYLDLAKRDLLLRNEVRLDRSQVDLSGNFCTLRASIFRAALLQDLGEEEIEESLGRLFGRELEGNNAYREKLGILERPLLRAGLQRYGSQLKLSEVLGINRNTLRKKLHEYRID